MNVSPYGEWRWSPMGLAGRDPVFYAQLDSEIAFVKSFVEPANERDADRILEIPNSERESVGRRALACAVRSHVELRPLTFGN